MKAGRAAALGGGCRGLIGGLGYTLGWFTRVVLSSDTIEFFEVRAHHTASTGRT
jgi:hypothetical protein